MGQTERSALRAALRRQAEAKRSRLDALRKDRQELLRVPITVQAVRRHALPLARRLKNKPVRLLLMPR